MLNVGFFLAICCYGWMGSNYLGRVAFLCLFHCAAVRFGAGDIFRGAVHNVDVMYDSSPMHLLVHHICTSLLLGIALHTQLTCSLLSNTFSEAMSVYVGVGHLRMFTFPNLWVTSCSQGVRCDGMHCYHIAYLCQRLCSAKSWLNRVYA